MCNKCEIIHSKLCQHHHPYKLDNEINEIFTGFCIEENHREVLEFVCKDHNKLCCGLCITKIKKKGEGQHGNCDVCIIEDIQEQKKDKLSKNLKYLKDLSKTIESSINKLKLTFNKMNENKEELKLNIQKIFTKIKK